MAEVVLSEPVEVNLVVYRGDSGNFRITVSDGTAPVDVSDVIWNGEIRRKVSDAAVLTNFDFVPAVDDVSAVDVFLPADKSELLNSNCVYDIQFIRGDKVLTILAGSIQVTKDVTRP